MFVLINCGEDEMNLEHRAKELAEETANESVSLASGKEWINLMQKKYAQAMNERDEQWKEAINKCSQPTLCYGSDQLKGKSPEEVIAIVHKHIEGMCYPLKVKE
jgi:hypothetical protein